MVKESDYLVSNQEILGGIKVAVSKGETLKDAMMTFYQAGYDKFEIEEAARAYLAEKNSEPQLDVTRREVPLKEKTEEQTKNNVSSVGSISSFKQAPVVPQRVSSYEPPKKMAPPKSNALTIILVLVLLVLLGVLISVFLFKEELVDFFNALFDSVLVFFK